METGIIVTQEVFLAFRDKEGKLLCIEQENGEIHRYITEPSTRGKSTRVLGADTVPEAISSVKKTS
jgi:hypothetical protein